MGYDMQKLQIDKYLIVPAPLTGINWVAVQIWDDDAGKYKHISTFRSRDLADEFIANV